MRLYWNSHEMYPPWNYTAKTLKCGWFSKMIRLPFGGLRHVSGAFAGNFWEGSTHFSFNIPKKLCHIGKSSECFPISHSIHVWYIYLHLADFYGKCRWIYHTWILWNGCITFLQKTPQNSPCIAEPRVTQSLQVGSWFDLSIRVGSFERRWIEMSEPKKEYPFCEAQL